MSYLKTTDVVPNKKSNLISLLVMIFCSIDTLFFGTNRDENTIFIGYIIMLFFAGIQCMSRIFIHKQYKISFVVPAILLSIALTMLFNHKFDLVYVYVYVIIIFAYFLSLDLDFALFKQYYLKIFDILTIASIIGFLLYLLAMPFVSLFPIITNSNGVVYYNLFLFVIPQDQWGTIFRSYGIFREPGIFAVYLILGILLELYNTERKINIKRLIFYVIAVVITYSTAGYLCAFLLFSTWLFGKMNFVHFRRTRIVVFILFCLATIILLSNDVVYNRIFSKFFIENNSLSSRLGGFKINLMIACRDFFHFIFGNGFDYTNNKFVELGTLLYGEIIHNTNTPLKFLAVYGFPFFTYMMYGIIRFCKKQSNNILTFIGLLLAMLMVLCNEDIILNPILYLLLFYATNKKVNI